MTALDGGSAPLLVLARPPGTAAPVAFDSDEAALGDALRAGEPWAAAALFDRYVDHVERVLVRVLGPDQDVRDLVQEVFLGALEGTDLLRESASLKAWITSIAVFTARKTIRTRKRRRWLQLVDTVPDTEARVLPQGVTQAVRATLEVLDRLPADERIPFALRYIDGMELGEVAAACRVSLATIKRRLVRAEKRFSRLAAAHPALRDWVEGGSRWLAT